MPNEFLNRRSFLVSTGALSASSAFAAKPSGRVLGANDRINVAVIGAGGRGFYVAREFNKAGKAEANAQIVGVCDVYQKRVNRGKEAFQCDGTLDYREILTRSDVDAVIVATPDHWHATIALEAMDKGKDVYLEKPMCHTIEEARRLTETVRETKRVLQVGSQTTSGDQWAQARKVIADGMLGKILLSQGSYHRNSIEGEWNWPIDKEAGPDGKGENFIDWKMWLGPAQKRDWVKDMGADRFFRFRKYWDYSGGIATDLYYHVVAPMNICWGEPQFPSKVVSGGGIYSFDKLPEDPSRPDREVPDTFSLIGEYPKGHSLVLSASMANSQHIPGLIRGHGATLTMVEHGRFEGYSPFITLKAEKSRGKWVVPELEEKFKGEDEIQIPVKENNTMQAHVNNFLSCMRTRQKPQLDAETGARAQVLITMAVRSFREGKVMYFDEKTWKVSDKPFRS
ncbi:MAG: Gfo/Idh/MocA family oxidoreductase [Bryobacter sp.]|jgi:predicted dehydrogenase|nr:Gfo/Idh/MocA family oxidoreductase [Bryobacter sp. CoA8 C33]